jgi:hypothetical protein
MSARRRCLTVLLAAGVALAAAAPVDASLLAGRSAAAPSVVSMIVGAGGAVLSPARTIAAPAATLRVGRKRCAVAAGTPLAVLVAVRRLGGPGFALRDYGNCGASAVNSGQLFVYSLGGERNRGQSGWEYKVDNVAGSTGAADPSGPLGNGRRLRSGQRVLWFWCRASGRGCQRTLAAAPASSAVTRGGSLAVTVNGYDNEGRPAPIAGAIVRLGSDFASTNAGGRATLIAPSVPGRYTVGATRRGLVPSFPETIVVR